MIMISKSLFLFSPFSNNQENVGEASDFYAKDEVTTAAYNFTCECENVTSTPCPQAEKIYVIMPITFFEIMGIIQTVLICLALFTLLCHKIFESWFYLSAFVMCYVRKS